MTSYGAVSQALSALDMLKEKFNWSIADSIASSPVSYEITNLSNRIESPFYRVPPLFLLLNNTITTDSTQIPTWLQLSLGLTELAGEAGSGKTQLCLGLCISCVTHHIRSTHNNTHISTTEPPISKSATTQSALQPQKNCITIPYMRMHNSHRINPYTKLSVSCPSTDVNNISIDSNKKDTQPVETPNNISHLHYRALYISMGEGVSDTQRAYRLNQMYEARYKTIKIDGTQSDTTLSRILTRCIYNEEEFSDWIHRQLPEMLAAQTDSPIGLIVMDSMAGLFRIPDDAPSSAWYVRRSGLLFQAAAQLKKLSFQYHVPIVLVNQLTSSGQLGKTTPALGLSWSHCINTRYLITRREEYDGMKEEEKQKRPKRFCRTIQLLLSSRWPSLECLFTIDQAGCKLV